MNYFDEYLKKYDMNVEEINYKYHHSYRVMDNMELIAKGLELKEKDIELAKCIGILHDIGRFEQFSKYHTFKDIQIDHGDYGVEVIKQNNILEHFNINKEDYNIVYTAIKNHNKYSIEKGLTQRELLFSKMIRDADKLDIIYVFGEPQIRDFVHEDDSEISEQIKRDFYKNKILKYSNIKTHSDRIPTYLAYIYDINYNITLKAIKEKQYIEKIYNSLKNKEKYTEYFEYIKEYMKKRVD